MQKMCARIGGMMDPVQSFVSVCEGERRGDGPVRRNRYEAYQPKRVV